MTPRSPSADVREIVALLQRLGYEFDRSRGGHMVFVHDHHAQLILASTPSDPRWRDNVMAGLRRRHPDHPELQRVVKSKNRRTSTERAKARRNGRRNVVLQHVPSSNGNGNTPPVERVPNPGSSEANAQGCRCDRVVNRNGVGVEGHDGVFEMRASCPLHGADVDALLKHQAETNGRVCECGNPIVSRTGRGRPRKYCETCRPSQWHKATEEDRERARAAVRAWYRRQKESTNSPVEEKAA